MANKRIRISTIAKAIQSVNPSLKQDLSLKEFVRESWHVIDGSEFVDNWHIDCITDHLEALFRRELRKLIICIPPRMGKSQICSVCFPAWVWTKRPETQIYTASYSRELCDRDSWRSRLLILSPYYQERWGHLFKLAEDSNRKSFYHNNKSGYRLALSTNAGSTGHGYDLLIIDDPHKATDVHSRSKREAVLNWYSDAISTRANNADAVQIVIGQRLHQMDLIGYLLEQGDWEVIKLPMEYIPSTTKYVTKIGWSDPRTRYKELLFPARFDREEVEKIKKSLRTANNIAAQLQQEPAPEEGAIIQRDWIHVIQPFIYTTFDRVILSFDSSMGSESTLDDISYAAAVLIGQKEDNYYIMDVKRVKGTFVAQIEMIKELYNKYKSGLSSIIVEASAAGYAVFPLLRELIKDVPLHQFQPKGFSDKVSRLYAVLDIFEQKLVHIYEQPWNDDYIDELLKFPKHKYDDQVDATVQGLLWMRTNSHRNTIVYEKTFFELKESEEDEYYDEEYVKSKRERKENYNVFDKDEIKLFRSIF